MVPQLTSCVLHNYRDTKTPWYRFRHRGERALLGSPLRLPFGDMKHDLNELTSSNWSAGGSGSCCGRLLLLLFSFAPDDLPIHNQSTGQKQQEHQAEERERFSIKPCSNINFKLFNANMAHLSKGTSGSKQKCTQLQFYILFSHGCLF